MPTVLSMGIETMLPPLQLLPWGLFSQVVPEVDLIQGGVDRTAMGAKYMTRGPIVVNTQTFDCDSEDDLVGDEIELTLREQLPFMFADSMACSSVAIEPGYITDWLDADSELTLSAALAEAATTQITADHLNLADDSTATAAATGVEAGIAAIEAGLAGVIANGRGYIFVSPTLIARAVASGAVFYDGNALRSARGHYVISDAGHGAENTLYGSGSMAWSVVEVNRQTGQLVQFNRATNRYLGLWLRYGIVLFNPAHSVRTVVS